MSENLIMGEETMKHIDEIELSEICIKKCKEVAKKHNTTAIKVAKALPDLIEELIRARHRLLTVDQKGSIFTIKLINETLKKAGIKCES